MLDKEKEAHVDIRILDKQDGFLLAQITGRSTQSRYYAVDQRLCQRANVRHVIDELKFEIYFDGFDELSLNASSRLRKRKNEEDDDDDGVSVKDDAIIMSRHTSLEEASVRVAIAFSAIIRLLPDGRGKWNSTFIRLLYSYSDVTQGYDNPA